MRAETSQAQQNQLVSRERPKYSKPSRGVKNNFQPTDNPADTSMCGAGTFARERQPTYFRAVSRAERRDL
jgi:hypothetical protein